MASATNHLPQLRFGGGYTVQAIHLDCRMMLGPMVKVQSAETLRRMLAYLGGTPAQLAELDDCTRRWGQGAVQITLAPGRQEPTAVAEMT